ncbi:hypothetical protein V6N13_130280 [Hibiscus sabdariffa]
MLEYAGLGRSGPVPSSIGSGPSWFTWVSHPRTGSARVGPQFRPLVKPAGLTRGAGECLGCCLMGGGAGSKFDEGDDGWCWSWSKLVKMGVVGSLAKELDGAGFGSWVL